MDCKHFGHHGPLSFGLGPWVLVIEVIRLPSHSYPQYTISLGWKQCDPNQTLSNIVQITWSSKLNQFWSCSSGGSGSFECSQLWGKIRFIFEWYRQGIEQSGIGQG